MSKNTCVFTVRYHEEKVWEFLTSTHLNPGTWIKPIGMDHLVHLQSSLEKYYDPSISEIPPEIERLEWRIKPEKEKVPSRFTPKLCFVKFVCLDKDRKTYPDKKYWRQAFEREDLKGKFGQITPEGTFYRLPNKKGVIEIDLIDKYRKNLFLGFSVSFCLQHLTAQDVKQEYYCSVDPLARIRPTDPLG